ncbi:MAG TPA: hypothetical protein PK228_00925 [Saprospiraceae bacterium]|nr:hypothetical protein [Saprospiraceae bacterium]
MKKHPEFQKERERLLLRREAYKQLIHTDLYEIKESLKPLNVAKDIIGGVASSFRDNRYSLAARGTRLAFNMLPGGWARRPLVGIAVSTLLPLLLRNLPGILGFVRGNTPQVSKAGILGQMKNVVSRLREKLHEAG